MSHNPGLPLVGIALAAAASQSRTAGATFRSDKASKSTRAPSFIRAGWRDLTSLWLRYLAWQARRGLRMLLHSLVDRTLRDIGLTRSEIEAAVSDIRWPRRPWRS